MLMTKEKAREFTNFVRGLIRAESAAGIVLADGDIPAHEVFNSIADQVEDGFINFLTSE